MPMIDMLVGMTVAAASPTLAPAPPQVAVVLIVADAVGQRRGRRHDYLTDNSAALLVTLHDLNAIALHDAAQQNREFESCFGPKRLVSWEPEVARCVGARLKPRSDGVVPIAVLVNDTRRRSTAQQFTCVGATGAIGEAAIYLADLFHPRPDIRAGNRRNALACMQGAIGVRR